MQIFVDSDGVLVDFDKGFEGHYGIKPQEFEDKFGTNLFWKVIQAVTPGFFEHLPLMPDAYDLMRELADWRPIILTGCPKGGWSEAQKIRLAERHFPGVPLVACMSRDKKKYCRPGDVLIDDLPRYKHLWEAAGGHFILHTSAKTSLDALKFITDQYIDETRYG